LTSSTGSLTRAWSSTEVASHLVPVSPPGSAAAVWWLPARFRSSPAVGLSVLFLVTVLILTIFAPVFAGQDPNQVNLGDAFLGPSLSHPLGTDSVGRDLFARLLYGARTTFLGAIIVVGIATLVGVSLAITGAWYRGWTDATVGRVFDGLMVLPGLLLALTATAVFGAGLVQVSLALSIAYVPWIGRITRSTALREVGQPYIAALRLQGFPVRRIWAVHLIPNLGGLILAQVALNIGFAMIDVAAMSFLGLGVQPPNSDWGAMVAAGESSILRGYPQESLYAGLAMLLTVLSFNVIGDFLGKRFDV
jgi:peptide/nickel transport system permease protein